LQRISDIFLVIDNQNTAHISSRLPSGVLHDIF